MGILGIDNRTENWKTVQHFHGLSDAAKVALVRRLGEPEDTAAEEIGIELFWCGMRDYVKEHEIEPSHIAKVYSCLFPNLHECIRDFGRFGTRDEPLKKSNYIVPDDPVVLYRNVRNTEVDIVLETPDRIFIGEAKYESGLGADGSLVLVHQLIRQYVTARILVHLTGGKKTVVPFVVTEAKKLESIQNTAQVKFMKAEKKNKEVWLPANNVLSWGEVNDIRFGYRCNHALPCQGADAGRLGR